MTLGTLHLSISLLTIGIAASAHAGSGDLPAPPRQHPTTVTIESGTSDTAAIAGEVVAPKADLTLRSQPPGIFFQSKGEQIGTAQAAETYRVLEQRAVPTLVGRQNWLKVQSTDKPDLEGWIYNGSSGTTANVSVVK